MPHKKNACTHARAHTHHSYRLENVKRRDAKSSESNRDAIGTGVVPTIRAFVVIRVDFFCPEKTGSKNRTHFSPPFVFLVSFSLSFFLFLSL